MPQRFCPKCKKTMDEGQFYTHKDGQKTEFCKKCMTMHIDNYNPDTYLWLLEKMDVPYIKEEWDTLLDRAVAKNGPYKLTGMSVFGKYLSKMKLKQWSDYSWEDTERLKAEKDMKMQGAVAEGRVESQDHLQEMLDAGEITQAEFDTLSTQDNAAGGPPGADYYPTNNPGFEVVEFGDIAADLTTEDKIYLAMKWGRLYRPDQWVWLERFYNDMVETFDVQGAARKDQVIKLAKTSLRMDEAVDCGDIDTYQKLSRVYDPMMKAGKFTEAQNKDADKGFVSSIGELVAICEKEGGFIPRFITDVPQDIVDATIQDMNRYTYNLVTKEMGLGQQIEDAIKKIEIQREMEENEELLDESEIDEIERAVLEDADFVELYEDVEAQREEDEKYLAQFSAGEVDDES